MVYLCFFLGQWCFVHHLNEPSSKASRKSTYTKLLDVFVKHAKKMHVLCGGHGLILWSIFEFFPVWARTYWALPGKGNIPLDFFKRARLKKTRLKSNIKTKYS